MVDVVIIGGGPAAYTAAIYIARFGLSHLVFEGDQDAGGQLVKTTYVENYPGVGKVMGYDLAYGIGEDVFKLHADQSGALKATLQAALQAADSETTVTPVLGFRTHALAEGAHLRSELVGEITVTPSLTENENRSGKKTWTVRSSARVVQASAVIVATGSKPRRLRFPSADASFFNLVTCATCDGRHLHYRNKTVLVIGGGDTAMEDAVFLSKTSSRVLLINRSQTFRASAVMLQRARNCQNVEILCDSLVTDVLFDPELEVKPSTQPEEPNSSNASLPRTSTHANLAVIRNVVTGTEERVPMSGVFFAIGHDPRTDLAASMGVTLDDQGYIVIRPGTETATSVPGVHAAGDCADPKYRQAVCAVSSGAQAAINVNRWLMTQTNA